MMDGMKRNQGNSIYSLIRWMIVLKYID